MLQMLGKITLFPYVFAPSGWRFCDGSKIYFGENETLFFMLQHKFGGQADTFGLPDLRKVAPPNCHYCISMTGLYRPPNFDGMVGETMLSFEDSSAQNILQFKWPTVYKNQAMLLHQYMGNRFGGDGNTLKLPNLQGKAPSEFRYLMCTQGDDPSFPNARSPFVGELFLLPYETTSEWLLPCNGRRIEIRQNPALYSLLGNNFGGDSTTFFNLPDLQSAAPEKFNYYIAVSGMFPTRP